MASSTLRNPQQVRQQSVPKTPLAKGSGRVQNTSLGIGSGKVINGIPEVGSTVRGKKN